MEVKVDFFTKAKDNPIVKRTIQQMNKMLPSPVAGEVLKFGLSTEIQENVSQLCSLTFTITDDFSGKAIINLIKEACTQLKEKFEIEDIYYQIDTIES